MGLEGGRGANALSGESTQQSRLSGKPSEASDVILSSPSSFPEVLFKNSGKLQNAFSVGSGITRGSVVLSNQGVALQTFAPGCSKGQVRYWGQHQQPSISAKDFQKIK